MTAAKRRRKRKAQRYAAWALLYLFELAVAADPTIALGAWLIPAAARERGYAGMGGEWLVVGLVFWLAFTATHKWVCKKLFEEEAKR